MRKIFTIIMILVGLNAYSESRKFDNAEDCANYLLEVANERDYRNYISLGSLSIKVKEVEDSFGYDNLIPNAEVVILTNKEVGVIFVYFLVRADDRNAINTYIQHGILEFFYEQSLNSISNSYDIEDYSIDTDFWAYFKDAVSCDENAWNYLDRTRRY